MPYLAAARRGIGVLSHQRGHVERDRQSRLAVAEQVLVAAVGLFGGGEARELAHRPHASAVTAGMDSARVWELAGKLLVARGQIFRGVKRLERNSRDGRGLEPVVTHGRRLEVLLPHLLGLPRSYLQLVNRGGRAGCRSRQATSRSPVRAPRRRMGWP